MAVTLKDWLGNTTILQLSKVTDVSWNWVKVGLDDSPLAYGFVRPQAFDDASMQREIDVTFLLASGTRTVSGTGTIKQAMDDIDEIIQRQAGSFMFVFDYESSAGSYVATVAGASGGVVIKSARIAAKGGMEILEGQLKFVEVDSVF